jgi:hypothetical protein
VSPRVRSRRALASRDPLANLSLALELEARCAPGTLPAVDRAIREAEAERPSHLCALTCEMALRRAESDVPGALAKLARARTFRALTPLGGYRPQERGAYLDHSPEALDDDR